MDNVVTGTDCENKALEYYTSSRNYLLKEACRDELTSVDIQLHSPTSNSRGKSDTGRRNNKSPGTQLEFKI